MPPAWLEDETYQDRGADLSLKSAGMLTDYLKSCGLTGRQAIILGGHYLEQYEAQAGIVGLGPVRVRSPIEGLFLVAAAPRALIADCRIVHEPVAFDHTPDFLIGRGTGTSVIVELDGHEWHERTPDQATRDKARDRYFAREGFRVIRFSGREVWRDPERCADEAIAIATASDDPEGQ